MQNDGSQFYKLNEGLEDTPKVEKNPDGTLRFPSGEFAKLQRSTACCGEHVDFTQEDQIQAAIGQFAEYLQLERDHYYAAGSPLQGETRGLMLGYFQPTLLEKVRVLELSDERVANPWFYPAARRNGLQHLPDLAHKAAVTFLNVVVFNEKFASRDLFHGLVQAVQVEVMGINEFADLFVRRFLQVRSYFLVPLNAHAFSLDAKFASNPERGFSVEEEVRRWWREGRY